MSLSTNKEESSEKLLRVLLMTHLPASDRDFKGRWQRFGNFRTFIEAKPLGSQSHLNQFLILSLQISTCL